MNLPLPHRPYLKRPPPLLPQLPSPPSLLSSSSSPSIDRLTPAQPSTGSRQSSDRLYVHDGIAHHVGERPHHRGRGAGGHRRGGLPAHARRALRRPRPRRLPRLALAAPHLRPPPPPPAQALLPAPRHALPGPLPRVPHQAPVRRLPRVLRGRLPRPPPLPPVRRLRPLRPRRRPLACPRLRQRRSLDRDGVHRAVAGGGHGRERGARHPGPRRRRLLQGPRDPRVRVQVRRAVQGKAGARRRLRQLRHGGVPGPVRPRRAAVHGGARRRARAPARDARRRNLLRRRLPAPLPAAPAGGPPPGAPRRPVSRRRPREAGPEEARERGPAGAEEQQGPDARAGHRRAGQDPRRGDQDRARGEADGGRRGGAGGRAVRGRRRRHPGHRLPQQRPTVAQGKRLLQWRGVPQGGLPGRVEGRVGALLCRLHAPGPRRTLPRRRQGRQRHRNRVPQHVAVVVVDRTTTTTAGSLTSRDMTLNPEPTTATRQGKRGMWISSGTHASLLQTSPPHWAGNNNKLGVSLSP